MDYIRQLNAFWRWRELHSVSHTQADLYLALLDIFNGSFWKEELTIPNKVILCRAELRDRKQLSAERKALCNLGLVSFRAQGSRLAGVYSLKQLYGCCDASGDAYRDATCDATGDVTATEMTPIYKTKNIKQKTKTKTEEDARAARIREVFDAYNEECPHLPRAELLTPGRRRAIEKRLETFSADELREAFRAADRSDFLTGAKKDWRAGIDWLIASDENILKVREGNYDNSERDPYDGLTAMTPTKNIGEIEWYAANLRL